MKKLLLLPIALMPLFLSGCEINSKHLGIADIIGLETRDYPITDFPIFKYKEFDHFDYGYKFADIIVKWTANAEVQKTNEFSKHTVRDEYASYRFNPKYCDFDFVSINIYEDGSIDTYCSGERKFLTKVKDQKTTYVLDTESKDKLFEEINNRIAEITNVIEEEEAKVRQFATLDNFFDAFEKDSDRSMYYYREEEYHDHGAAKTRRVEDHINNIDDKVMGCLKELQYVMEEEDYYHISAPLVECHTGDQKWFLTIDANNPARALLSYYYDNTLYDTALHIKFQISETKRLELKEALEKAEKASSSYIINI